MLSKIMIINEREIQFLIKTAFKKWKKKVSKFKKYVNKCVKMYETIQTS